MVDMSFSPEAFSESFPGFSPSQGGGDAPSTPSVNDSFDEVVDRGPTGIAGLATDFMNSVRSGSASTVADEVTLADYDPATLSTTPTTAEGVPMFGGANIASGAGSLMSGPFANPVKSGLGFIASMVAGAVFPQLALPIALGKATGVFGKMADDIMFDRGLTQDDYNEENAEYISDAEASLDSPYIPPAATATPTQSQSSIPPAANPYLRSPNQYNVGGLDIQYPTRNSQNIIAPTDYRTAAATPLDYANVIAPPGTPYYRTMAAGGYVDRPLYPSPRITGR